MGTKVSEFTSHHTWEDVAIGYAMINVCLP
jgi:hypothetical protein